MNRRSNERIEMRLPCQLTFPSQWESSVSGITANMHRDGVLISCDLRDLQGEIPKVGSKGRLQVELPPNPSFTRKCIICDTILVRTEQLGGTEIQFALTIATVAFRDLAPGKMNPLSMPAQPSTSLPV